MLDLSCSVLPLEAAKRVISLLYFEALICNENRLAAALEKMLGADEAPSLHYETNSEELLLAELFGHLSSAGALPEDWEFAAKSRCVANGIAWYAVSKAHEYMKVADVTVALNL